MLLYILRRLLWMAITLFGVSLVTFVLIFAGPVDPARALVGEKSQAATIEALRKDLGLDQPVYIQYIRYMGRLLQGDLGKSFYFNQPVAKALAEKLPATAALGLSTAVLIVLLGIPLGAIAAMKSNTIMDRTIMVAGLLTISLPNFFFGLLLMYLLAFKLDLFPVGGYGTIHHLFLPALSVALPWSAWYAIMLRANMLDAISADYVRTANAKGLAEYAVVTRHVLRNAILPVLTMLGMDTAALLTGLALVEYIFSWPGIGWQTVQAAQHFDVPLIMGSVLFGAVLIGVANLLVDVLYTRLDPRVQLG
ncbi:ABC transporter permease [Chloroflexi bacterium TSY]|nr:ABC transporter permease [Chloroflexi bacterium TSY]